jgi:uncharacterized protein (DUF488 family)
MKGISTASRLYTIGHSNIEPGEFIRRVKQFHVELLVDVRSKPYSRYVPHFNKEEIEHLCRSNGIKYLFLGDLLGGKPEDDSVTGKRMKVNYDLLAKKDYFLSGIDTLLDLVSKYHACLMCSEAQPDKCHRSLLLGPVLEERGVEVLHILPDGTAIDSEQLKLRVSKKQLTLF